MFKWLWIIIFVWSSIFNILVWFRWNLISFSHPCLNMIMFLVLSHHCLQCFAITMIFASPIKTIDIWDKGNIGLMGNAFEKVVSKMVVTFPPYGTPLPWCVGTILTHIFLMDQWPLNRSVNEEWLNFTSAHSEHGHWTYGPIVFKETLTGHIICYNIYMTVFTKYAICIMFCIWVFLSFKSPSLSSVVFI